VSTISKAMVERALSKGVAKSKTLQVPNWADLRAIVPLGGTSPYRAELGIASGATVALYSGSMGVKQGVDWLASVALQLKDEPNLVFVFSGDGPLKAVAQAMCGHLPNVRFIPLQPAERLSDLLGMADIHLLPQRPEAGTMVMPSKLTGMLASGRPVVAMAEAGSELADVVQSCGLVAAPGDLAAFAQAVRHLSGLPQLRTELGHVARTYADNNLSAETVLKQLAAEMQLLVGGKSSLDLGPATPQ
jgi:colanic acid biosynthesis glycosyl transferase WcaI